MCGSGSVKVSPKRLLKRSARSRVSSMCWRWSSPTGTCVGLVEQDVRDLEDRVREEADGGPVGALLGGLVLELRHPRGLAEAGEAVHDPAELGVLGDVALDEEGAALGVETGGEQLGRGEPGVGTQLGRILRHGDRVQVDDHVERVVGLLQGDVLADRTEVVPEVERACGGLDTGERTGTVRGHVHHSLRCASEPIGGARCIKGVRTREGTLEGGRSSDRRRRGRGDRARARRGAGGVCGAGARPHARWRCGRPWPAGAGADAEDVVQSAFLKAYRRWAASRTGRPSGRGCCGSSSMRRGTQCARRCGCGQLAGREAMLLGAASR